MAEIKPFPWQSMLYVPAHDEQRVRAALNSEAHAVVLDLEDFVPDASKPAARDALTNSAATLREHGIGVVVRINRPLDQAVADLHCAVLDAVDAIMVTKVMGADHLTLLDELVGELEDARGLPHGRIKLIALIETAAATQRMAEICQAGGRLCAVGLGGEDIARECGFRASAETLLPLKQQLIYAAFAGGVTPIGFLASVADKSSPDAFAAMVARSREFGFRVATCLTAAQVATVNAVYGPAER